MSERNAMICSIVNILGGFTWLHRNIQIYNRFKIEKSAGGYFRPVKMEWGQKVEKGEKNDDEDINEANRNDQAIQDTVTGANRTVNKITKKSFFGFPVIRKKKKAEKLEKLLTEENKKFASSDARTNAEGAEGLQSMRRHSEVQRTKEQVIVALFSLRSLS